MIWYYNSEHVAKEVSSILDAWKFMLGAQIKLKCLHSTYISLSIVPQDLMVLDNMYILNYKYYLPAHHFCPKYTRILHAVVLCHFTIYICECDSKKSKIVTTYLASNIIYHTIYIIHIKLDFNNSTTCI